MISMVEVNLKKKLKEERLCHNPNEKVCLILSGGDGAEREASRISQEKKKEYLRSKINSMQ